MCKVLLFGLEFQNKTITEVVQNLMDIVQANKKKRLFFINAHCVNIATQEKKYSASLRNAELLCADGSGMAIASRLAKRPFLDNVNGTDLFPVLCEAAKSREVRLGFLGAKPGVAKQCAQRMQKTYMNLDIAYCRDGYFTTEEEQEIVEEINNSGIQILLVAQGVPRQELFIDKWFNQLNPNILMGVGALFDFYSGNIPRAPKWIRSIGMEWFYRLILEPKRLWRRYVIGNVIFLTRCFSRRILGPHILINRSLNGE